MFDITYNANKSFCMVIGNKPEDKKNIHLADDDDDIAMQKRCIYAEANVLARKFNLYNSTIKQLYLIHTVV